MVKSEKVVLEMTNAVIVAFLSKNEARPEIVNDLIRSVHATLADLAGRDFAPVKMAAGPIQEPKVPIADSVHPDFVICLECGRRLRTLQFHLTKHGLSPKRYIAKWALPKDYPMAAPKLKAMRSASAIESKFGQCRKRRRESASPPR